MEKLEDKVEELLKVACEFQGKSLESRQRASKEYRKNETDSESAIRVILDGLMAKLAYNMQNKVEDTNEKISYQISLSSSYVRTHYVVNDLILNGDLVEATTLIRKQLESLARLHEIDNKPLQKLIRKTPNVINTLKGVGKGAYPHLSEIAHFASPKAGDLLHVINDGEMTGPSMLPIYTELSHGCFDLQVLVTIYFLFWFIQKQTEWYEWFDGKEEETILFHAFQVALDSDVIRKNEA